MRLKFAVAGLLTLLMQPGAAWANLVVNGSFEQVPLSPGAYRDMLVGSAALPGWTIVGVPGTYISQVESGFPGNPGYTFAAQDGNVWTDLAGFSDNAPNGVRQTISTTIGTRYEFGFWLGNVSGQFFGTQSAVDVAFSSGGSDFSCMNATPGSSLSWQRCGQTFTATSTSTTFTISNSDPSSDFANPIDNVTFNAVASGVPEPSTWAMMLIGFAGLGLAAKGKHRRGSIA